MNELSLFAGIGGGILGGQLLGWRTVCAVENDAYCASVLIQRQNEGFLPVFPIWSDIETFDGRPWNGIVDIVSGGFPCQDISVAGNGEGVQGKRSGLWGEMARIIREVEPRYVFVENSPALTRRGLHIVLKDLASMGYDAEWGVLGAGDIGASHKRDRIWVLAHPSSVTVNPVQRRRREERSKKTTPAWSVDYMDVNFGDRVGVKRIPQPGIPRVVNGIPNKVDQLKSLGNAQVPGVAAAAFIELRNRLECRGQEEHNGEK